MQTEIHYMLHNILIVGGPLVGQNFHPNQSNEFQIG